MHIKPSVKSNFAATDVTMIKTILQQRCQFTRVLLFSLFLGLGLCGTVEAKTPDIVVADFEGTAYPAGWSTTGTAFGDGPAHGTLDSQMDVSGFDGHGFVNSFHGQDASVGTLTSSPFALTRRYLSFLIGGGHHPNDEKIDLLVDGEVICTATGNNSEHLTWVQWELSKFEGKSAVLRMTDTATGSWGHIMADDITLTDSKLPDERMRIIALAMAGVEGFTPKAEADLRRPAYHYHSPGSWMNDPNGPIYYQGWYSVFYQCNPYSSESGGNIHWGHARSKDLVNWQQMPIAIWPSQSMGEDQVYSGSVYFRADGTPMAFYTSIGGRDPEQWGAISHDPELNVWSKSSENPLLTLANHGSDVVAEWRDPFLFTQDHVTYMLVGGGQHGRGVVNIYKADKPDLTAWTYLGVLFEHPDSAIGNIECPNLAHIDGKWLLLTSTYGKVETFVGQIDFAQHKFITEKRGILADGSYASQLFHDADGSLIHFAWMPTNAGSGWNGYLTLPSTLHITPDGTIIRQPIAKLTSLRGKHIHLANEALGASLDLTRQISGKSLELVTDIDPGTASSVTIHLRARADGTQSVALKYDVASRTLSVPGRDPSVLPSSVSDLTLHIFLDNGALDVYAADGAVTLASFLPDVPESDTGVRISTEGGAATIKTLDIYEMKPAVIDNSRFEQKASLNGHNN